jgi:hypothetical protein
MNLQDEKWMHAISQFAGLLEQAEYEVFEAEAIIKKTKARLMLEATAKGYKTAASQDVFAENSDSLYQARLDLGVKKGKLTATKVRLDAVKIGFDEWRTKMVNSREEQKRYGA